MKEQSFTRYKFTHPEPSNDGLFNLPNMLGLDDAFAKHVQKTIEHEMIDEDNFSIVIENVMNKILPNNTVEALWLGFALAKSYEIARSKAIHTHIIDMIKSQSK